MHCCAGKECTGIRDECSQRIKLNEINSPIAHIYNITTKVEVLQFYERTRAQMLRKRTRTTDETDEISEWEVVISNQLKEGWRAFIILTYHNNTFNLVQTTPGAPVVVQHMGNMKTLHARQSKKHNNDRLTL